MEVLWIKNYGLVKKIDTIVNAAKPTLMGSDQGVDGTIHKEIDNYLSSESNSNFRSKICEELQTIHDENLIRCKRGNAVTTKGYGFCKYVIHAVGIPYDGNPEKKYFAFYRGECTSSCVKTLERCYTNIVEEIRKHTDMKVIGIPIIGSGEYKVPFEVAVKIAIASVGNALVKWKREDKEMFEMSGIEQIIFFVYNSSGDNYECADKAWNEFQEIFVKEKRVVHHTSTQAFFRYWQEITQNDDKRGYFALAKGIRHLLMAIRLLFFPLLYLKDCIGKCDWEKRRRTVEFIAFGKIAMASIFCCLVKMTDLFDVCTCIGYVCIILSLYCMFDTITYLLMLILMVDIQNPSANLIRSLILLFVNYIEVSLESTFLYYYFYAGKVGMKQALVFGLWGERAGESIYLWKEYILVGLNTGVRFFFVTLALGYLMGHMRQREFRS